MLQTLDNFWREHLAAMDYLRQGIHLRGYAQKNPKQEYKREAFELFVALLERVNYEVIKVLSKFEVRKEEDVEHLEAQHRAAAQNIKMEYQHADMNTVENNSAEEQAVSDNTVVAMPVRNMPKVGRNEPCPCGSGKKYKQCHGSFS
jgi:preprotein translocase subunit SecA